MDRLLELPEAAKLLGLKPNTMRVWIHQRKIDYVKVGKNVRIRFSTIEDYLLGSTVKAVVGPIHPSRSKPAQGYQLAMSVSLGVDHFRPRHMNQEAAPSQTEVQVWMEEVTTS
jgi:excisionase family DNA binding protein